MTYNNILEMKARRWVIVAATLITYHLSLITSSAQSFVVNPEVSYAGTPRQCEMGGIAIDGVEGYEDEVIVGLSGLSVG